MTGARKRKTASPLSLTASASIAVAAGAEGRSRTATPFWARMFPLPSRIIAPTTSDCLPSTADIAPSSSWFRSGLSSVRTPYLLL